MKLLSKLVVLLLLVVVLVVPLLLAEAEAAVPPNGTFKLVNSGDFGPYIVEYDGNYRTLDVFSSPFQLCFYNTTNNAYTLALRMGLMRSESLFRWVWEANRGNPVKENATLTLGTDGNLVLSDSDGRVAWQTGTANKGVVGFKLLPTGNMVLHDAKGKFVWQSFDYPTDTLLVGQSLKSTGPGRLVSRASAESNTDGPYSLVIEARRQQLAFYYKSPKAPNILQLLYYKMDSTTTTTSSLTSLTLDVSPEEDSEGGPPYAYDVVFTVGSSGGTVQIARPKYNATLSFLRLGMDGNLKLYTYNDEVDWKAWEVTFTLFEREPNYALSESECQLPERCGELGICEDSQCVACPDVQRGLLLGWSKGCRPPKLTAADCKGARVKYYKIEGVDHFTSKYTPGVGPIKDGECGGKCTNDCDCLGYFYNRQTSRCWIAYDLNTLTKVNNSTHLGYIKI